MVKYWLLVICIFFVNLNIFSQKGNKEQPKSGTKDKTEFNPIQEMGSSRKYSLRDDYVWGINTAFTTYHGAMDINVLSPLRYGLSEKVELNSNILMCIFSPNIFIKYQIKKGKVWIASRHGVYFPTMALKYLDSKGYITGISDSTAIPFVGDLRNELILSYPFFDKTSCNSTQPYLILSFLGGVDFGMSSSPYNPTSLTKPWLVSRMSAISGNGFMTRILGRVDYMYYNTIKLEGEIAVINDNFTNRWGFENRGTAKFFLYQNLSVSVGWLFAKSTSYSQPKYGIMPFLDLSLNLGTKQNKMKGLWNKKMH